MVHSPRRFQVIIVQIKKNKEGAVKELWKLPTHIKIVQGENYKYLGTVYGSPKDSLARVCAFYLDNGYVENPLNAFYEILKVFTQSKKLHANEVMGMALWNDMDLLIDQIRGKRKEVNIDAKRVSKQTS